ncbi:MAG: hypothetical protein HY545_01955 [Candidatus Doudnabacteria bacterium]|nr:hypothetical protein [Candidatus Doudnabacteria bacterium]
MQDINLLQSKVKDTTLNWQRRSRSAINALVAIVIILAATGVTLFFLNQTTLSRFEGLKRQNIESQNNLNQRQQELSQAKSFQAQLKNLSYLTNAHIYWSSFFKELAAYTFNKAQYVAVEGDTSGKIHVEGNVESYADLGRLILGLSTSEKFKQVKLLSASPTSTEQAGYLFSIDLTASPGIFNKQ